MKNSRQAQTAAAIRKELKENFPTIKFSITSESHSMMTAVDIRWTDGATEAEVRVFTDKYQYENREHRTDIPQARFVSTIRSLSEAAKTEFTKIVIAENDFPETYTYDTFISDRNEYVAAYVRRASFNHSFKVDGIYF